MLAAITYKKPFNGLIPVGLLMVYTVIAYAFIPQYFLWDVNVITGLLLSPYVCTVQRGRLSLRYLWPAVLSAVIALAVPGKTPLFFALLFTVLLLIENYRGRVSAAFLFLVLLCSPVFSYVSGLAGFPIRLWLSKAVANTLCFIGKPATAAGNIISFNGGDFSVDPACAGLNMLAISFIIGLFIIAYRQRLSGKRLHFLAVVLLLLCTFALNVGCNLFRILVLVLFNVMPGNLFHDLVGVFCLIIYVILPLYLLVKLFYRYLAKADESEVNERLLFVKCNTVRYLPLHFILLIALCLITSRLRPAYLYHKAASDITLNGYHKTVLESTVIKFENKDALIYLKPTTCYGLAHDPTICWTGSGYVFTQIKTKVVNKINVYTGTLKKGKEKIYAAWWFDNGRIKTINQLNWRWRVFKGEQEFYLVNVNAMSVKVLEEKVGEMLARK